MVSTEGIEEIVNSRSGSKPGDPLGDIIFSFAALSVLHELESALGDQGLLVKIPEPAQQDQCALRDPTANPPLGGRVLRGRYCFLPDLPQT